VSHPWDQVPRTVLTVKSPRRSPPSPCKCKCTRVLISPSNLKCHSFFAVRIWKCQSGASSYPDSVFTLSLVSQKNVPIAVALVSARLPSPLLPSIYSSKGHIYRGTVWYVNLPSARETITQLPPSNCSCFHQCVALHGVNDTVDFHPQQYTVYKCRVFDAFIYYKLTQRRRIPVSTFAEGNVFRVHFSFWVLIFSTHGSIHHPARLDDYKCIDRYHHFWRIDAASSTDTISVAADVLITVVFCVLLHRSRTKLRR